MDLQEIFVANGSIYQWKDGRTNADTPLPHLMDIWKAAGKAVNFLAPDFYNPDFKHWCDLYTRQGDALFVPEHALDNTVAAKVLFTIANYQGIRFSPFSIESTPKSEDEPLGKMYGLIHEMTPIIVQNQGKNKIKGVFLSGEVFQVTVPFVQPLAESVKLVVGEQRVWLPEGVTINATGGEQIFTK